MPLLHDGLLFKGHTPLKVPEFVARPLDDEEPSKARVESPCCKVEEDVIKDIKLLQDPKEVKSSQDKDLVYWNTSIVNHGNYQNHQQICCLLGYHQQELVNCHWNLKNHLRVEQSPHQQSQLFNQPDLKMMIPLLLMQCLKLH